MGGQLGDGRVAVSGHVLVTGFGPFEDVVINASGEVVRGLEGREVGGLALRGVVLPTAFGEARRRAAELAGAPGCRAVLGLGVWRGGVPRLERRARGRVGSERRDVHGEVWAGRELGVDLESERPVAAWASALGVALSEDCGGYVCNAVYHAVLATRRDGLFVHVPRDVSAQGIARTTGIVVRVIERLIGHDEGATSGGAS